MKKILTIIVIICTLSLTGWSQSIKDSEYSNTEIKLLQKNDSIIWTKIDTLTKQIRYVENNLNQIVFTKMIDEIDEEIRTIHEIIREKTLFHKRMSKKLLKIALTVDEIEVEKKYNDPELQKLYVIYTRKCFYRDGLLRVL